MLKYNKFHFHHAPSSRRTKREYGWNTDLLSENSEVNVITPAARCQLSFGGIHLRYNKNCLCPSLPLAAVYPLQHLTACRVRHFNRRPHLQRARLPSLVLLKLPGRGSVGTCPRCRWGTAHCWIRPAARSASAGWPRCKWPRPPASPPSSARSWSSGTPSRTPGRGCSSRSNTGRKRQTLREHCRTQYKFFFLSFFFHV